MDKRELFARILVGHRDRLIRPDGTIDLNLAEALLAEHGEHDLNYAERYLAELRDAMVKLGDR
jgi:hypothetical protein